MSAVEVRFVDLTDDEYDDYMAFMVPGYAGEVAIAFGMSAEEALARATRQIGDLLPDGRQTPGHAFRRILDAGGHPVGYLWLGRRKDEHVDGLYIYDIRVDEAARGRGIGTATLDWVEAEAGRLGAPAVALSVAGQNTGAIRLYERMGFEPDKVGKGGMSMIKRLAGAARPDTDQGRRARHE